MSRKIRKNLLQRGDCEKGAEYRPESSISADSRWRPAASAQQGLLCSSIIRISGWADSSASHYLSCSSRMHPNRCKSSDFQIKKKKNQTNIMSSSPQVNFILFLCIVRILRQKINCPDIGRNESNQYSWVSFLTANLDFCLSESVWEKWSLINKAEGPYICFHFAVSGGWPSRCCSSSLCLGSISSCLHSSRSKWRLNCGWFSISSWDLFRFDISAFGLIVEQIYKPANQKLDGVTLWSF